MPLMKKLVKLAGALMFIPVVKYYLRKDRNYSYQGISIKVIPGVFHPGLYFSTKILMNYIATMELSGFKFLELGAGSGLISMVAAKKGAIVSASDISPLAIKNLQQNADLNSLSIQIISSDLFDSFPLQTFDFISIQPPYYPKDPASMEECAWYCGKDFDFYRKLFRQIGSYTNPETQIYMILSDDCEIGTIKKIAAGNGYEMIKVFEKKILWEWNFIFRISQMAETDQRGLQSLT